MGVAAANKQTPVLDREELEIYVRDVALQREMFQDFFSHAPKLIAEMRAAIPKRKRRPWRDNAHAIKGTALYLGFRRLVELTSRELANKEARASSVKLARLEAEIAAAKVAAGAYLAAIDAAPVRRFAPRSYRELQFH